MKNKRESGKLKKKYEYTRESVQVEPGEGRDQPLEEKAACTWKGRMIHKMESSSIDFEYGV